MQGEIGHNQTPGQPREAEAQGREAGPSAAEQPGQAAGQAGGGGQGQAPSPARPGLARKRPSGCRTFAVVLALGILAAIGAVFFSFALAAMLGGGGLPDLLPRPAIGLIRIEGLIQCSDSSSLIFGGGEGAVSILSHLRRAEKDDSVKAVVVWLNSPGGSAAASQMIYQRVRELAQKKPVIAAMGDVAASGAYWVACGCQRIFAEPATQTGSIGVIVALVQYHQLMQKFGITSEVIKSGKFKDAGSPFRPLTDEERALFRGIVEDVYEQFVEAVATGRHMPVEKVKAIADGRIFTGRQAVELGLVDQLGGLHDAIRYAAEQVGIKQWPRIKTYREVPGLLRFFAASQARPWWVQVLEQPGPWAVMPVPGLGFEVFAGAWR